MDERKFSKNYLVRKLTNDDVDKIYQIEINNDIYFKFCPPKPSKEKIIEDINALPPKKTSKDKYYLGYFEGDEIIEQLEDYLCKINYQAIRLGYIRGNIQSESFWHKQHFRKTGIITKNDEYGYEIIVLEKKLSNLEQIALLQ